MLCVAGLSIMWKSCTELTRITSLEGGLSSCSKLCQADLYKQPYGVCEAVLH